MSCTTVKRRTERKLMALDKGKYKIVDVLRILASFSEAKQG